MIYGKIWTLTLYLLALTVSSVYDEVKNYYLVPVPQGAYYFSSIVIDETAEPLIDYLQNSRHPVVHIDSPGGSVATMFNVFQALNESREACVVERFAASAAANIAMWCDVLYVHPQSIVLFHNMRWYDEMPQGPYYHKNGIVFPQPGIVLDELAILEMHNIEERYIGLFTIIELSYMERNVDIPLTGQQLIDRGYAFPIPYILKNYYQEYRNPYAKHMRN